MLKNLKNQELSNKKGKGKDFEVVKLLRDPPKVIRAFLKKHWHASFIVSRGKKIHAKNLQGVVARRGSKIIGMLTYRVQTDEIEIVSLDALEPSQGIGSALLSYLLRNCIPTAVSKVWLITTNDNLNALRFYQKKGFRLVTVHRDAIVQARKLKPSIPLIGNDGIPIVDEIELELLLNQRGTN